MAIIDDILEVLNNQLNSHKEKKMATKATRKTTSTPVEYDTNYVPDFVQRSIAGAKGKGSHPRPFMFSVKSFKIHTKSEGVKVNTYLLFGGVPSKKLHEKLDSVGFKVRRRSRTWTNAKKETVDIVTQDRECYAVYYTLDALTDEQVQLIGRLFKATAQVVETGKTFLAPNWATVEKMWGNKDEWLAVCAVDNTEDGEAPAPEEEDTSINLNDEGLDDLI
jgi:hypothetical protein